MFRRSGRLQRRDTSGTDMSVISDSAWGVCSSHSGASMRFLHDTLQVFDSNDMSFLQLERYLPSEEMLLTEIGGSSIAAVLSCCGFHDQGHDAGISKKAIKLKPVAVVKG